MDARLNRETNTTPSGISTTGCGLAGRCIQAAHAPAASVRRRSETARTHVRENHQAREGVPTREEMIGTHFRNHRHTLENRRPAMGNDRHTLGQCSHTLKTSAGDSGTRITARHVSANDNCRSTSETIDGPTLDEPMGLSRFDGQNNCKWRGHDLLVHFSLSTGGDPC